MGKYISQERKEEVLSAVKNGMSVADASSQFQVSIKAVYRWLRLQADNTGTSSLEVARLRRENTELKELIGMFTLDKKRAEKNHRS
ncbi:MAG: helix-turn-helix domain-containing protein [Patescibacteria group bacterium]